MNFNWLPNIFSGLENTFLEPSYNMAISLFGSFWFTLFFSTTSFNIAQFHKSPLRATGCTLSLSDFLFRFLAIMESIFFLQEQLGLRSGVMPVWLWLLPHVSTNQVYNYYKYTHIQVYNYYELSRNEYWSIYSEISAARDCFPIDSPLPPQLFPFRDTVSI